MTALAWLEQQGVDVADLGLDRVHQALRLLDLKPVQPYQCIVVGGTNGKGSVVAVLKACLSALGLTVGSFTSPHLISVCERIQLNQAPITEAEFSEKLRVLRDKLAPLKLSYFEWVFLTAVLYFHQQQPDCVIYEVGLGGRLDAVNTLEPDLSIITSIDYDHQQFLGDTLEAIALEKAGILRAGRPLLYGGVNARSTIAQAANQGGAILYLFESEFAAANSFDLSEWSIQLPDWLLPSNAACALQALSLIQAARLSQQPVEKLNAIETAINAIQLPGRLDHVYCERQFLLDVAHNPAACRRLSQYIGVAIQQDLLAKKRIVAVFSVMADKDYLGMMNEMAAVVDIWLPVVLEMPRALPLVAMVKALDHLKMPAVSPCLKVSRVYDHILLNTDQEDWVIVFGSFHLLGALYAQLSERNMSPL